MVAKRPKIVVIGAGIAGLTAIHKLFTTAGVKESFELCVVEGGERIGGRINTTEFGGDRIEMGATWIHGISGSPIYEFAKKINALESDKSWECMDELHEERLSVAETRAEGGFVVSPDIADPISSLFDRLMSVSQGKADKGDMDGIQVSSIGSFLKLGLHHYWGCIAEEDDVKICGEWSKRMLEEGVFGVSENTQRTYTGAGDLFNLDYAAESEYRMFPGDEITIPRGYISIIEALASVLPPGMIQLGRKVVKIEWLSESDEFDDPHITSGPVKLHFSDGSVLQADHVIVTVSLGILKAGINEEAGGGLFSPSLPLLKKEAISRLGYGVVNKLFLQLSTQEPCNKIPFMKMVFHAADSEHKHKKIPWWMRRTASIYPIHNNSSVLLSWFAGKEALELESLDDQTIIDGVSTTIQSFTSNATLVDIFSVSVCHSEDSGFEFREVLRSKWGTDPLFLGSYSYVAVGSSGDDFDILAEPLPRPKECGSAAAGAGAAASPPLQILFAGEATHRTHYSTTHGAYFSGLREANRLLQHYHVSGKPPNIWSPSDSN